MIALITCEHATNFIPQEFRKYFLKAKPDLKSHAGWDVGAAKIARWGAHKIGIRSVEGKISRLLMDINRTAENPDCYSKFSKSLSQLEKIKVQKKYYDTHWERARKAIHLDRINQIHFSIHSFTPIFKDYRRSTDIGILFDPSRIREKRLALKWKRKLKKETSWNVHFNRPYRGTGNGMVSSFRNEYLPENYLGFEIEINQRLLKSNLQTSKVAQKLWSIFLECGH